MAVARVLLVAVALGSFAVPAPSRGAPHDLRHDLRVDVPVTVTAAALWIGTELAKDRLAPSSCRICDGNGLDDRARARLVWKDKPDVARHGSDLLAMVLLPAAAFGHSALAARDAGAPREALVDALVIGEAVALSASLNQLVKFAVARQRPFVRFRNFEETDREGESDDYLSFYSGHTALAFSTVAAAATVAQLRGYESAPWVWGVGVAGAASVGYLRIAADKHYLTDVLTGAVVGTLVGIAAPRLLHPRERGGAGENGQAISVTVVPLPLGVAFAF
jgi:membrane-associated phospholipid phosphatase